MKKIVFKELIVEVENNTVRVEGKFDDGGDIDTKKKLIGSILQCFSDKGDIYGNPITDSIKIEGNKISGQQET